MAHTENNTQSEVKGTAPDQSRNRSRTRERSNKAVNSIGRNKIRIRKCFDQSLLPWSLGHLKATFIATFFSSRFLNIQWKSKQVISKVYSLIPLLGRTGRWKPRMCTDPHKVWVVCWSYRSCWFQQKANSLNSGQGTKPPYPSNTHRSTLRINTLPSTQIIDKHPGR